MIGVDDGGPATARSLRDDFAKQIILGLLLQELSPTLARDRLRIAEADGVAVEDLIAAEAYQIADAMLKARRAAIDRRP